MTIRRDRGSLEKLIKNIHHRDTEITEKDPNSAHRRKSLGELVRLSTMLPSR
jgi:hypothetical protein